MPRAHPSSTKSRSSWAAASIRDVLAEPESDRRAALIITLTKRPSVRLQNSHLSTHPDAVLHTEREALARVLSEKSIEEHD